MKKVILLATAFMFVAGVALADKGKKKKCAKGKSCSKTEASCSKTSKEGTATKACCKDKAKTTTASM
ncbi:MAG: hypothetical protein ABIO79_10040 [Ferruginibacter sp.]